MCGRLTVPANGLFRRPDVCGTRASRDARRAHSVRFGATRGPVMGGDSSVDALR